MGKSTLAKILEDRFFGLTISSDGIQNIAKQHGFSLLQISGFSKYLICYLMKNSKNHFLIIDRSVDRSLQYWKRFAKAKGYKTFYIRLVATKEEAKARIIARGQEVDKLVQGLDRSFERYTTCATNHTADCVVDILNRKSIKKMLFLLKQRLKS